MNKRCNWDGAFVVSRPPPLKSHWEFITSNMIPKTGVHPLTPSISAEIRYLSLNKLLAILNLLKKYIAELFRLSPEIEQSRRKPLNALILGELLAIIWCLLFSVFFAILGSWMAYMVIGYAIVSVFLIRMLKRKGREQLFIGIFCIQLISLLLTAIYH